uniref:Ion transport domain-containing protein n=1 Tax=Amphilophus citrinellus TaxID=61819 RepID=A0A3Q0T4U2_AMPCI
MVSLLPPVGMEVFRPFTVASLEEIQQQHEPEAKEQKTRKDKKATEKNLPNPAAHLETGKPLPFIYGDPPPQFFNIPLEDLDPFYQSKKVFMVLSNGNIINRFSANSSCYLLSPFNPLRTVAIKILLQPYPLCPSISAVIWYVCLAIYMFEALVKVVARGFCAGHFTFLRDPWNWLDIVIISTL